MLHECEWLNDVVDLRMQSDQAAPTRCVLASHVTLDDRTCVSGLSAEAAIAHENARRLDWSNRRALQIRLWRESLEHAEHDGADKGDCEIRGNNAQSAD